MTEEIILTTKDGVRIYADYYKGRESNSPAVVLLHMMPATKESWHEFASKLQQSGFQALAIDFRGHGKSISKNGQEIDYRKFGDADHQKKIIDVETAINFFTENSITLKQISLVGASIGANLSMQYMSEHPEIKAGVALSPGLNYRGVETEKYILKFSQNQSIYLLAGGASDEYSTETIKQLYKTATCKKQLKVVKNKGHGTDLFIADPKLMDEIIEWLKNIN